MSVPVTRVAVTTDMADQGRRRGLWSGGGGRRAGPPRRGWRVPWRWQVQLSLVLSCRLLSPPRGQATRPFFSMQRRATAGALRRFTPCCMLPRPVSRALRRAWPWCWLPRAACVPNVWTGARGTASMVRAHTPFPTERCTRCVRVCASVCGNLIRAGVCVTHARMHAHTHARSTHACSTHACTHAHTHICSTSDDIGL